MDTPLTASHELVLFCITHLRGYKDGLTMARLRTDMVGDCGPIRGNWLDYVIDDMVAKEKLIRRDNLIFVVE